MKNKIGLSLAALAACFALGLPAQSALAKTHMVACKDGTHAKAGRGACSGHGGVGTAASHAKAKGKAKEKVKAKAKEKVKAKEQAKAPAKTLKERMEGHMAAKHEAAKKPEKAGVAGAAGATARCKDGSYSHAKTHRGACSRHGGVAEWMKH